eukprot:scaffold6824_cov118-Isochrysis_galbana.AAC.9
MDIVYGLLFEARGQRECRLAVSLRTVLRAVPQIEKPQCALVTPIAHAMRKSTPGRTFLTMYRYY